MMSSPPKLPSTASKLIMTKNPVPDCSTASSKNYAVAKPNHDSVTADRARKRTRSPGLLRDGAKTKHLKKFKENKDTSESSDSESSEDTPSESEDEPEPKKVAKVTTTKTKYRGLYHKFMLSDSDSEEDESKMSAAQLQRKRNIEARQEFLKKLDMEETKRELEECFKKAKKERKPHEVKPKESLPPRPKSLRIQNPATPAKRKAASPSDPALQMDKITQGKFTPKECFDFFVTLYSKLYGATQLKTEMDPKTCTLQEIQAKTASLTLRNEQSSGVLPEVISSFALHPSSHVMLLGAGGKSGSVGFWNVDLGTEDWNDMDVMVFLPHINNVSALTFSKHDTDSVFSCSFDGTVRRGDLTKQMFQLLYAEDNVAPLHCITEQSKSRLFASKQGGNIVSIDTRVSYNKQGVYRTFHHGIIHTLSVNPKSRDQLLSCSEDGWLALWDLRMLGSRSRSNFPLWQLNTEFPVGSAFYSESGSHLLTTHSNAELICIYETQPLPFKAWEVQRAPQYRSIGAVAKAVWHPQREDVFCVPNNNEGLDVYCCNYTAAEPLHSIGEPLHLPMKRCTHAIFHPTLPAMVASCRHRLQLFL